MTLDGLLNVPIEVTSLTREKPSDAPAVGLVVTEETIRQRGYATLLDVLQDVPQVEIAHWVDSGRENEISMQGLHDSQRFLVLIDGVRVTPNTGNLYPLGRQFSVRNAQRVEFVFGPVSALYGPDAVSGVINIVTKRGDELDRTVISTGFGNFESQDTSLVIGKKLEKETPSRSSLLPDGAVSVTAHTYHSGGPFLPNSYPKEFGWYNTRYQAGLMHLFNDEVSVPFRKFSAGENASFLHTRIDLGRLELGLVRMSESHSSSLGVRPDVSLYVPDAVFQTNYQTLYGKHHFQSGDERWTFQSILTHSTFEVDPRTKFLNQYSGFQDAYKYARDASTIMEERISYEMSDRKHLLLGLTYQKHSSLPRTADLSKPYDTGTPAEFQGYVYPGSPSSSSHPEGIPLNIYNVEFHNVGAFTQLRLKHDEHFQTTLGVRYDRNTIYGHSINPRVCIVYKPRDRRTYKVMYGEAFLAPSPDKTYQHYGSFVPDSSTASGLKSFFLQIPNPDLEPERARSAQAEMTWRFSDRLWGTLSAYRMWLYDLHQTGTTGAGTFLGVPVDNLSIWKNQGTGNTHGGTFRLDSRMTRGRWNIGSYAAYSYSNGDINGEILPYSARHSIRAGLDLTRGRWSFSPRIRFQSRSYNMTKDAGGNLQSSSPFTVLNLHIGHDRVLSKERKLGLYLDIQNALDTRYYNPARADDAGFGAAPQWPRTVMGGLTLEF